MIKEDDVRDDVPGRKLGIAKSKDEQIKGENWRKETKEEKRQQKRAEKCEGV